jgi:hypothetical protein
MKPSDRMSEKEQANGLAFFCARGISHRRLFDPVPCRHVVVLRRELAGFRGS